LYHDKSHKINEESAAVIQKTVYDLIKNQWTSEIFQSEMKNCEISDQ